MPTKKTRSPIKDLPLRQAGQSSREHLNDFLDNRGLFPCMMALCFVMLASFEWWAVLSKWPRKPWMWTALAGVSVVWAVISFSRTLRKAKALRLGITGEEAVGQYLENSLRPAGFHILHDIPAAGFNLDHIVIGPTGVFVIETKTHSKPAKGASAVRYDGETVSVNGFKPDRDPIMQAKAEARWLFSLLERSTGRKVFVQPIVIYPGWFVEPQPAGATVWVLNEKALPSFIGNAKQSRLSGEDIHLLAFHLAQYVLSKR
jgi:hypothetical protein